MTKNTKTVLHNVTLSKSDTCLTFVLKRLDKSLKNIINF